MDAPLGGDDDLGVEENLHRYGIKVVKGGILSEDHVKIYTLNGRKVSESKGYIRLSKGVYFIKVKGRWIKVVIK